MVRRGPLWDHAEAMAPRERLRLGAMHRGEDRLIAGVCSGIAESLGVDPIIVRTAFIILTIAGGFGIPLYLGLWFLMREPDGTRGINLRRVDVTRGDLRQLVAVCLLVAGTLLLLRALGLWFSDALVWPLTLAGLGVALLWARTGDEERARLANAANRLPGRPFESLVGGWQSALRLCLGSVLVFAGLGAFLAANDALAAARQVAVGIAVAVSGLALILAPWIRRMTTELADERRERIRSEERAEMAAHLHDSVLQTLALIQRKADQPRELVALARRQERELRAWLYGGTDRAPGTLVSAIEAMAAEVEGVHGVEVDVVSVGDTPLGSHAVALVQAAREAVVNAAKHSGATSVSVYVEADGDHVTAFVRDRGHGFDPDAVPADRRGIASSIRDRMTRNGGHATITSSPAEGTEVILEVRDR
jgi:signal transduction histidine kinase/phage shock protein PspC (stress-responsive transcriptional regulator)